MSCNPYRIRPERPLGVRIGHDSPFCITLYDPRTGESHADATSDMDSPPKTSLLPVCLDHEVVFGEGTEHRPVVSGDNEGGIRNLEARIT